MQTNDGKLNSVLQDFFFTCLKEMYWSEVNLRNMLVTMADEASADRLQQAFYNHSEQTDMHARTLEEVFALVAVLPEEQHCVGLQGLIDEGWKVINDTERGTAQRDVALIIAAQKVEHYEIAAYGSIISLAKTLGHIEVLQLLESILKEEKETDEILTAIAESGINVKASKEPLLQAS